MRIYFGEFNRVVGEQHPQRRWHPPIMGLGRALDPPQDCIADREAAGHVMGRFQASDPRHAAAPARIGDNFKRVHRTNLRLQQSR